MKKTINIKGKYDTHEVWLDGEKLDLQRSLKIRNHSPTGFSWGYLGSGPAQLALAICIELYGARKATDFYQGFKEKYISQMPQADIDGDLEIELTQTKEVSGVYIISPGSPNEGILGAEWEIENLGMFLEPEELEDFRERLQNLFCDYVAGDCRVETYAERQATIYLESEQYGCKHNSETTPGEDGAEICSDCGEIVKPPSHPD
ncbi:MAG: hypothetical protein KAS70_03945 [Planctomycetes bacterium]|nr:hypothetical protein [Planctomycetota bacterium]